MRALVLDKGSPAVGLLTTTVTALKQALPACASHIIALVAEFGVGHLASLTPATELQWRVLDHGGDMLCKTLATDGCLRMHTMRAVYDRPAEATRRVALESASLAAARCGMAFDGGAAVVLRPMLFRVLYFHHNSSRDRENAAGGLAGIFVHEDDAAANLLLPPSHQQRLAGVPVLHGDTNIPNFKLLRPDPNEHPVLERLLGYVRKFDHFELPSAPCRTHEQRVHLHICGALMHEMQLMFPRGVHDRIASREDLCPDRRNDGLFFGSGQGCMDNYL